MRIAFISDIHGNYTAFKAVLKDIETQKVDEIIHLGDAITMGPQPLEVLNQLREMGGICIRGNHDAAVLEPDKAAFYQISEHLKPDLLWCGEKLNEDDQAFLRGFKDTHEFTLPNNISVLCFHGSPASCTDLIQATTTPEDLDRYFPDQKATIFIGGHSHIQMHRRHGNKLILNAGSIGNAFEYAFRPGMTPRLLPWAEYAILDHNEHSLEVDMRRVYFDIVELMHVVRESKIPGAEWWLKQYQ